MTTCSVRTRYLNDFKTPKKNIIMQLKIGKIWFHEERKNSKRFIKRSVQASQVFAALLILLIKCC
jgi:hypothetical protein